MPVLTLNNFSTYLASGINNSQTTVTLPPGMAALLPSLSGTGYDYVLVTVYDKNGSQESNHEVMKVTSVSGNDLIVVRGFDGTSARTFAQGAKCEARLTKHHLDALQVQENMFFNGAFEVGSLGSTVALGSDGHTLDGVYGKSGDTHARVSLAGTSLPESPRFNLKVTRSSGVTRPNSIAEFYFEPQKDIRSKAITVSFLFKTDAALTLDVSIIDSGSNLASPSSTTQSVTTTSTWQFLSFTFTSANPGTLPTHYWLKIKESGTGTGVAFNAEFTNLKIEQSSVATKYSVLPLSEAISGASRYFFTTFGATTNPANNVAASRIIVPAVKAGTYTHVHTYNYPLSQFSGSGSVSFYNPSAGTAGMPRNETTGTDCTVPAVTLQSGRRITLQFSTPAGTTAGDILSFHFTVDARPAHV